MSLASDIGAALKAAALRLRASAGQLVHDQLRDDVRQILASPDVSRRVARVARGEVKDYLQELAEGAGMPFSGPQGFLAAIREQLAATASTNLQRDPDEPYDPASDSPFEILGQLRLRPFPELDDRGQD